MAAMNMIDALRRGLDRASFEADKMMRANRVKIEAQRLSEQARKNTIALGEQVLELHKNGVLTDPKLSELAGQIADLHRLVNIKEAEANAITAEAWPEPEEPAATAPTLAALPAPAPTPVAAPTHCRTCGVALRPGALFCQNCGAKV